MGTRRLVLVTGLACLVEALVLVWFPVFGVRPRLLPPLAALVGTEHGPERGAACGLLGGLFSTLAGASPFQMALLALAGGISGVLFHKAASFWGKWLACLGILTGMEVLLALGHGLAGASLLAALGLAGTYAYEELKKPFIVARVVPNLDAPEIKQAVASNYLQSMGMLFEMPTQASRASLPAAQAAETVTPYEDEGPMPWDEAPEEPEDSWSRSPEYGAVPDWADPEPQGVFCSECRREITGGQSRNGRKWSAEDIAGYSQRTYGRVLCPECQEKMKGARR